MLYLQNVKQNFKFDKNRNRKFIFSIQLNLKKNTYINNISYKKLYKTYMHVICIRLYIINILE